MSILTNTWIVADHDVVFGTIVLNGALIAEIQPGRSYAPGVLDLDGDVLIAGVVDVHTDNLERQVQPRSNARWPSRSALLTHDAQCAVSGVTTVFDALCLGDLGVGLDGDRVTTFRDGVRDLDALANTGLLKSEHFLHLRCELPAPDMLTLLEPVAAHPRVGMVSIMDHTPGVGQYADLERYREIRRRDGMSGERIEQRIIEMQAQRALLRDSHRRRLLERMADGSVPVASHDDRTEEEVEENYRDGIRISEFPVSLEAAKAARARGMKVIAGAPNIVRGGSHSGNVSAAMLIREQAVDGLASDYVPASLVEAAFACVRQTGISLPASIAMVTSHPAAIAGLDDRGRISPGFRADLVRVRVYEETPVVRQVWRTGERVI
jgi:alpha-D-ribose 1-methylphosphonate 5-triphosphate diphosphatase